MKVFTRPISSSDQMPKELQFTLPDAVFGNHRVPPNRSIASLLLVIPLVLTSLSRDSLTNSMEERPRHLLLIAGNLNFKAIVDGLPDVSSTTATV